MAGVFINYRSDAAAWAVMLDGVLSRRFGSERVFRASRSIRASEDFTDRIPKSVRSSSVVLALIGPTWLAADENGHRRIDDHADWVRREIAEALAAGIPIIPILTDNAPTLDAADLPPDIAALSRRQYLRLHHRNSAYDIQRIFDELDRLVPDLFAAPPDGYQSLTATTTPPTAAQTASPSPELTWKLAEKLAQLRSMIDEGVRQQIVETLPIQVAVRIRRRNAVLSDVHAIVAECLEYDGALSVLLRAVRRLEGPSLRMRELEVMLNDIGFNIT
jgi:hypothetical protein